MKFDQNTGLLGAIVCHNKEIPALLGFKGYVSDGQGGQVESSDAAALYKAFKEAEASNDLFKLQITIRPHINSKDNANKWDLADDAYAAITASFAGRPFLKDHNSHEMAAKAGRILSSKAVGYGDEAYMLQEVEVSAPWAIEDALRGLMDGFSIQLNMDGLDAHCSICGGSIWENGRMTWECAHWPGYMYEVEGKGKMEARWVVTKATGKETSEVVDPAVSGTGIEQIKQLAASCGKTINLPREEKQEQGMNLEEALTLLASREEELKAKVAELETLQAAKDQADQSLQAEKEAHQATKQDLGQACNEALQLRANICDDLADQIVKVHAGNDLFADEFSFAITEETDLIASEKQLRCQLLAEQILIERDKRDLNGAGLPEEEEQELIKAERERLMGKGPDLLAELLAEVRRTSIPRPSPPMGRGSPVLTDDELAAQREDVSVAAEGNAKPEEPKEIGTSEVSVVDLRNTFPR